MTSRSQSAVTAPWWGARREQVRRSGAADHRQPLGLPRFPAPGLRFAVGGRVGPRAGREAALDLAHAAAPVLAWTLLWGLFVLAVASG
jgi:hypothetical protein